MGSRDLRRTLRVSLDRLVTWTRPGRLAAAAIGFPLFFVLSTALLTVFGSRDFRQSAEQPVEFNHRLHVEDLGLECGECHQYYETETFSGMPTAETCALCHEEAQGDDPEEVKLASLLSSGQQLEWQPLFRQPPHVFYSHRRHIKVAGIECATCHGSIAATEAPPARVDSLDMDGCMACHEEQGAANDCTSCHR